MGLGGGAGRGDITDMGVKGADVDQPLRATSLGFASHSPGRLADWQSSFSSRPSPMILIEEKAKRAARRARLAAAASSFFSVRRPTPSLPHSHSSPTTTTRPPHARHRATADHEKKETPASKRASERPFGGILTRTHHAGKGGDPPHRRPKQDCRYPPFNLRAKREGVQKQRSRVIFSRNVNLQFNGT